MSDRDAALRAARAEVDALRALLDPVGLGASVTDAPDPADRHDADRDAAAIAAILGADGDHGAGRDHGAGADDGSAPVAPVVPMRRSSAVRRRWWSVAAAAAVVAVVGTGISVLPGRSTPAAVAQGAPPMLAYPIDPQSLAEGEGGEPRATLLALAAAASAQTDPEPAGDVQHTLSQNYWTSTTVDDDGSTTTIDPVVSETWVSPDGSSVNAEWRGAPLGADGLLEAVGTAHEDAVVDRIDPGTFDAGAVAALPADPTELRAALLAPYAGIGCGPDGDPAAGAWCLYFAITGLADFLVLPSDVEAALWTVLADEPGVTIGGSVEDRAGHEAVAVAIAAPPTDVDPLVRMLLIDRATGRLSGREEITLSSQVLDIDEPTVTYFRYTLVSSFVAEVGWPED